MKASNAIYVCQAKIITSVTFCVTRWFSWKNRIWQSTRNV